MTASAPHSDKVAAGIFHGDVMPAADGQQQQVTLVEVVSTRARQHCDSAASYISQKNYEAAIVCLNKAICLDSSDVSFYVMRAECYLKLSDLQSAILNYRKACILQPEAFIDRLAFLYCLRAQCLADQKCYVEALEDFSRASELRPGTAKYRIGSLMCMSKLGLHGDCLHLANQLIHSQQPRGRPGTAVSSDVDSCLQASETNMADLLVMRARIHLNLSHTADCFSDVLEALSVDADHAEANSLKAALDSTAAELRSDAVRLTLLGRHKEALSKLNVALATNPNLDDLHVLRGSIHRRLGDFNAAIDDFLLAMSNCEDSESESTHKDAKHQLLLTYNDFAVECISKQFYSEAILLLDKAIKEEKHERGLYVNRAECFYRQGNIEFALADYKQALELSPGDKSIRSRIAEIHCDSAAKFLTDSNFVEAEKELELAVKFQRWSGYCYLLRAKLRQCLKDTNRARRDAVTALLLDVDSPELITMIVLLFPGKSLSDVFHSSLAAQIRLQLGSSCRIHSDKSAAAPCNKQGAAVNTVGRPVIPDAVDCSREKRFHQKLTDQKKEVNDAVKKVLKSPSIDNTQLSPYYVIKVKQSKRSA